MCSLPSVLRSCPCTHSQEQSEEPVIQLVEHCEPAAEIDAVEASQLVAQQYCGFVEHSIGSGAVELDACDSIVGRARERIFLCKVDRMTESLRSELCSGTSLKQCR